MTIKHEYKIRWVLSLVIMLLCNISAFAQLTQEAEVKITELEGLISDAEAKGLDATKEKMTVHTSEIFLKYAQWDEENVAINVKFYQDHPYYKDEAQTMAEALPNFEREGVIEILDEAIATIQKVISGDYVRKDVPNFDWSDVELNGNRLEVGNQPVFLADYTWKHQDADLTKYFGQLNGDYITPNYIINDQGDYSSWPYNELKNRDEGTIGDVFLDNNQVPSWAKTKYPDITVGGRHYGKYDLDHPGSREMYSLMFEKFIPLTAGKRFSELGYMLFNEPSYFTMADTWNNADDDGNCVSNYTIEKYKTWLSTHHTDINALNTLWGTSFTNFDEVTTTLPMPGTLQGTPEWYDWMTFNNHRVTEWFQFIKTEIQKYDDDAKVHIKLMPWLWAENSKDHGMDFEALTELSDIIGCDAGAAYNYAWGDNSFKDKYSIDWRESMMTFDFFKSIKPDEIIFDTENHFLIKTAFTEYDLNQDYVNAIYWLGFSHGLTATSTWVWSREVDGSIIQNRETDGGYIVGVTHQPKTLNTLTATVMDINSHSEEVAAIQELEKPIRVFYSKTSGINNSVYMDEVFETYESLFFEGIPIGFATENILKTTPTWEVVVVSNTVSVTQDELNSIQNYLNDGGTVILQNGSLAKDEYGRDLEALTQGSGTLIKVSSLADIKTKALEIVEGADKMPDLNFSESTSAYNACNWRVITNDAGNKVLLAVNLGKADTELNISLKNPTTDTRCVNLLTGEDVSSNPTLKPMEVFFVEILDEESNVSAPSISGGKQSNFSKIYPNPSSGDVNIYFTNTISDSIIEVRNTAGNLIQKKEISGVMQTTIDLNNAPIGTYLVHIANGSSQQVHKYIKVN